MLMCIHTHTHTQLNEENISNDFVVRDLMAECQGVSTVHMYIAY